MADGNERGNEREGYGFPVGAGILLGLGIGGFFDGILLHQILQWHHMLTSAGYPADTLGNLEFNVLWDGLFHASTYIFVTIGLAWLWHAAARTHIRWSGKMLIGSQLIGFGAFNVVEGLVDHHLLGIHHVNETVPVEQWIYWDVGFLVWGALMWIGGWLLLRAGKRETAAYAAAQEHNVRENPGQENSGQEDTVHGRAAHHDTLRRPI